MIEVQNLTKTFKKNIVLSNINLVFDDGLIHGLIGRIGSGKTVLMKCICGLLRPTSGKVLVDNKEIGKDCDFIEDAGILIEHTDFIKSQSGFKNLHHLAMVKKEISKEDIRATLEIVGLKDAADKAVRTYSMGMRQRLGIAQAIMENPSVLILDEPFNGLDRNGVIEMRELLLDMKYQGKTIILASHYHEDIEMLCDTVTEMEDINSCIR